MNTSTSKLAELGLVALGGAVGTLARYLLNGLIGDAAGVPLGILIINISGAFLLGIVVEGLALRGPDQGRRRQLRLLLGTGILGGYTTYSMLADDVALMLLSDHLVAGVGYGLVTLLLGLAASWLGIVTARAFRGRRSTS